MNSSKRYTIAAVIVSIGIIAAAVLAGSFAQSRTVTLLSTSAFIAKSQEAPDSIILDVRSKAEFESGHFPNAMNIDADDPQFDHKVKSLDPSKTYLVYCRSGRRSAIATQRMSSYGFKHLYELQGGIAAAAADAGSQQ